MNNFGIMFHHFHDENKHIISQGSISGNDLQKILKRLKKDYEILDAGVFCDKAISRTLQPNQICLTFDDALAGQYDIAYPILEQHGIKAFWFLYTSMYTGVYERLEIYRHFRHKCFSSIESFYNVFFKTILSFPDTDRDDVIRKIKYFDSASYRERFSFYSDSDKLFRFLRDEVLGQRKYRAIMDHLIETYNYDIEENKHLYWITKDQILDLYKHNHVIGLHSHTHSTKMSSMSFDEQIFEYGENKRILEDITGGTITAVSYPCSRYNSDTDKVMRELGIGLGFDAVMTNEPLYDNCYTLHFPRQNHTYISGKFNRSEGRYENYSLYM